MGQTSRGIVYPSNYSAVADVPADLQIMAQSIDDILQEDEQNIQNNSDDIATIQENVSAHEQSIQDNTTDINTLKNQVQSFALVSETGNKVEIEINSLTYIMKIILKDKNNNVINTSNEIDLPLETMVVGARYDSTTKELVLTLKNGQETRFSIADLVDGLVSQSDFDDLAKIVGTNTETIENNTSAIANNMKDIKQNEEDIDAITKLIDTEFDTNIAEGTTIDVDDSAEWDGIIGVGGNTEQKQLSGKNKINTFAQKSTVVEGITVSVDEDGIVTLNGTCTRNNTGVDLNQIIQGDGKTYTLKAEIVDGTYSKPSSDLRFNFHVLSSGYNYEGLSQQFGEANSVNKTLIAGHEYDVIGFRVDLGIVLNNLRVKVQLEEGDTATGYEQYCGGRESPNPDYTQETQVVKGANVIRHVEENLFDSSFNMKTQYGVTVTYEDGIVTINGTSNNQGFVEIRKDLLNMLGIGNHTLILQYLGGIQDGGSIRFSFGNNNMSAVVDNDNRHFSIVSPNNNNLNIVQVKDFDKVRKIMRWGVWINNNITFNNYKFRLYIVKGAYTPETIPAYKPYKERLYGLDFRGKNKFDKSNYEVFNGYMIDTPKRIRSDQKGHLIYLRCTPNTQYTISREVLEKNFSVGSGIGVPSNQIIDNFITGKQANSLTITTGDKDNYLYVYVHFEGDSQYSMEQIVEKLQVEEGPMATEYEEYNSLELCELGNYEDILFKNVIGSKFYNAELEEGAWYKKCLINKINPNSSDGWQIQSINANGFVNFKTFRTNDYIWSQSNYNRAKSICNAFTYDESTIANVSKEGFMLTDSQSLYIRISQNRFKTVEELKNFLDENKVFIYYIMKDAVYEKITDPTLISQLEALLKVQMYHGVNHFYVETDNLEPNMELTYKQSNKIKNEKQNARLDNIESRLALLE